MADAITELYIFLWNHKLLEVVLFLLVILSIWAVGLRIEKKIALPLAAKDTVGDLPIVEHFDDGRAEVLEKNAKGWSYPMTTTPFCWSTDIIRYVR